MKFLKLKLGCNLSAMLFSLLFAPTLTFAQESSTRLKTLIVESVYVVKITTLSQPIKQPANSQLRPSFTSCSSESPEEIVLAYFDALRSADVKRSNLCWAPDSLRQLQERDRASGRDEEYWKQRWLKTYAVSGFDLSVIKRAEYGVFTIIQVQIKDAQGKTMKDDFALERIGSSWKLTQRLAADPVLQYWDSDKTRVQVAPQSWEPKAK